MNQRVSAYRMDGENHVPINVRTIPGIDEQLIAREDEKMARMQKHLRAQMKHPEMTAERALMAKIDLQVKAHDNIHNPEVCHCPVGKQHCHLNVRSSNNGQVLTRGQCDCCVDC